MSRKSHSYHYVYRTICLITNRYYIGVHSTSVLDDGYLGSGKRLRRSIYKYGKENHAKEILEYAETREKAEKLEEKYISKVTGDLNCMNLTNGGTGFKMNHSTETKNKISAALSNKTYEEIHGVKNAERERNKRRESVKRDWKNADPNKKKQRIQKISESLLSYFETHKIKFTELECPHCGAKGKTNGMYRWHFDNCKNQNETDVANKTTNSNN